MMLRGRSGDTPGRSRTLPGRSGDASGIVKKPLVFLMFSASGTLRGRSGRLQNALGTFRDAPERSGDVPGRFRERFWARERFQERFRGPFWGRNGARNGSGDGTWPRECPETSEGPECSEARNGNLSLDIYMYI